jgi:glycosyltransferase involved in cell wall biosynthesis
MNPKVAIIIANYNYGDYVINAIKSIENQTYDGPIKIFLVDDGSSDDSWEKLSEYKKEKGEHASLINEEDKYNFMRIENSGASVARNIAIEAALGWADIFGILDSDDEYYPEKVEKLVAKLVEHPEVGVAYADYDIETPVYSKQELKPPYDRQVLLQRCIVHSNSLIKKEYLEAVRLPNGQFFDSRLHGPASKGFIGCTEDYDLWIRLSKICIITHVPECLARANEHGNNQSLKMTGEIFQKQAQILGSR